MQQVDGQGALPQERQRAEPGKDGCQPHAGHDAYQQEQGAVGHAIAFAVGHVVEYFGALAQLPFILHHLPEAHAVSGQQQQGGHDLHRPPAACQPDQSVDLGAEQHAESVERVEGKHPHQRERPVDGPGPQAQRHRQRQP